MVKRTGDSMKVRFRVHRFFRISQEWFVATRENSQIGPFDSRDEAEIELMFYLRSVMYRRASSLPTTAIKKHWMPEPINELSNQ